MIDSLERYIFMFYLAKDLPKSNSAATTNLINQNVISYYFFIKNRWIFKSQKFKSTQFNIKA